jgi:MFS family permease
MQDSTAPQSAAAPESLDPHEVDYGLLWLVCLHALISQVVYAMLRVTISYRAVEIGLPGQWVGYIAGFSAILPMLIAVTVGRFVDRGNDVIAARLGAFLMLAACIGFRWSPAEVSDLLAFTAMLGVGHLFLMVSHQMLCVRSAANDASRETAFGHYMVATAFGQGGGPMIVGWLGGAQRIPPTRLLFATAVVMGVVGLVLAYWLRSSKVAQPARTSKERRTSLGDLLRTRGVPTLMIASIITVTAQDLLMIYMPLLGTERSIEVHHIGTLLMLRSAAAVVSRLFYPPMIRAIGRVPLTVLTMVAAAVSMAIVASPVPLPVLYAAMIVAGFGLGIAATLSISNMVDIVPSNARAVALSLRITGNRVGQVSFPVAAGLVAAATGAAGIFGIMALGLAASAVSVQVVRGTVKK